MGFFLKSKPQSRGSINLKLPREPQFSTQESQKSVLPPTRFIIILALSGLLLGYYFYTQYQSHSEDKAGQAKRLTAEVGELILLPDGEIPTIATVADPKAFRSQTLFQSAQTGDKVLVFTSAKKAILYRPSIHKLVEVVPFEIAQEQTGTSTRM